MNISNNLLEMLTQQTKKKKKQHFGTSVTNQIFKKGAPDIDNITICGKITVSC